MYYNSNVLLQLLSMLSPVLSDTLAEIYRFRLRHGMMPSVCELMAVLQKSHGAVQSRRDRLKAKGYVTWFTDKNRSMKITTKGIAYLQSIGEYQSETTSEKMARLPFLGEIAAGYLSEPIMQNEFIEVEIFDPKTHFALRISGDSMIGAGIVDRSTAIFKRVPDGYEPKSGQIVAAYVEGSGTTLKRFYRDGLEVTLEAANPNYPPQIIDTAETFLRIDGILRSVTIVPPCDS